MKVSRSISNECVRSSRSLQPSKASSPGVPGSRSTVSGADSVCRDPASHRYDTGVASVCPSIVRFSPAGSVSTSTFKGSKFAVTDRGRSMTARPRASWEPLTSPVNPLRRWSGAAIARRATALLCTWKPSGVAGSVTSWPPEAGSAFVLSR
jgi:hypothetical protein